MSLDRFLRYVCEVQEVIDRHTGICELTYAFNLSGDNNCYDDRDKLLCLLGEKHKKPITKYLGTVTLKNEIIKATVSNLTPYGRIPLDPGFLHRFDALKGKGYDLPKGQNSSKSIANVVNALVGCGAISLILVGSGIAMPVTAAAALYSVANYEWQKGHTIGALTKVEPIEDSGHDYSSLDVQKVNDLMKELARNTISYI